MSENGSDHAQEPQEEVEAAAPEGEEEEAQAEGEGEQEESAESAEAEPEPEPYERTDKYDRFLGEGFPDKVSQELDKTYQKKLSEDEELDDRAIAAVKELDEETALQVLKHFCESDLSYVQNKSAYLCGAIKMFRTKGKNVGSKPEPEKINGPDEAKIKELLERTGYSLNVTRSQRQYGGPPPGWEGDSAPAQGTEVFVKNIPKDWYEDKLVPLFEPCGKIYDIRLILDPVTGYNKGFAFVCFCEKSEAQEAIKTLNGHKANERFSLSVSISYRMNTLYVGSIPKTKKKDEILEEFGKITTGLKDVTLYTSQESNRNRGFAFLEYEDHKSAAAARRSLMNKRVTVFGGVNVTVDWADPVIEPDEETMAKVKVVYVRNLTSAATEEKIKEKFAEFGEIEKVKKMKDYCFVNFKEREGAIKSIEEMNDKEYEGSTISVCLAKPPQENKKKKERLARMQNPGGFWDNQGYGRGGRGGGMRGRGGMGGGYQQRYPPDYGYEGYYGGYDGGYAGDYGDWSYGGFDEGYGYGYGSPRGGRGGRGQMRGGYYHYPKYNRISGRKTAKV